MNNTPRRSNRLLHRVVIAWGNVGATILRQRWFTRAPIALFDAGLGRLFGAPLLMIEHTGRRSGPSRRVVLEVVDHPSANPYLVASGFGAESQWLRNIETNPNVRVWVGGRRAVPASTRILSREEAVTAVDHYASRHHVAWAALRPVFEATLGAPAHELPGRALRRRSARPPWRNPS